MEMTDSMAVSVTALDAQRQRLNVISSNLANAQSTKRFLEWAGDRRGLEHHISTLIRTASWRMRGLCVRQIAGDHVEPLTLRI